MKKSFIFKNILLSNALLLHTPFHSFFQLFKAMLEVFYVKAFRSSADFRFTSSIDSNRVPFNVESIFGNRKKSQSEQSGEFGVCLSTGVPLAAKYLTGSALWAGALTCWNVHDFFFPQLWQFLTNSLSQCCKNFHIVSLVNSLTLWNPFSHHDAVDVEKKKKR